MSERITGAEALVRCLEAEGVDIALRLSGRRRAADLRRALRLEADPHDPAAARAGRGAHGRRLRPRRPARRGVALVTSGPGATNTVTGIANAYMDSIPMVVFTAQVATAVIGTDAFQESDITGITLPITKHNYLVKDAAELPEVIKEAFHIATTGPPGPGAHRHPGRRQQGRARLRVPRDA